MAKMKKPIKTKKKPSAEAASQPGPISAEAATVKTLPRARQYRIGQMHQRFTEQRQDPNPERRFLTAEKLGEWLGHSKRTIFRDIEVMKDDLHLPVDEIPGRGGWGYTEDVTSMPTVLCSQFEAMALCVSMGATAIYERSIFAPAVRTVLRNLTGTLCQTLNLEFDALVRTVSFHCTGGERDIPPENFELSLRGALLRQELEIEYEKLESAPAVDPLPYGSTEIVGRAAVAVPKKSAEIQPARRRIEPLHVACIDFGWYLLAYDPERDDVRTFALRRIRSIRMTGRKSMGGEFDVRAYLRRGIGAYSSGEPVPVHLRFWGQAARVLPEMEWHETQRFERVASKPGTIDMHLTVAINPKLVGLICQWLGQVVVVEPASLRDTIRRIAQKAVADQDAMTAERKPTR